MRCKALERELDRRSILSGKSMPQGCLTTANEACGLGSSNEEKKIQTIEKVRPYMHSHGGNVELLSLQNDFATFRLQGSCKTCPSSSITMELALRRVLEEDCPDLAGFAVEGAQPATS